MTSNVETARRNISSLIAAYPDSYPCHAFQGTHDLLAEAETERDRLIAALRHLYYEPTEMAYRNAKALLDELGVKPFNLL